MAKHRKIIGVKCPRDCPPITEKGTAVDATGSACGIGNEYTKSGLLNPQINPQKIATSIIKVLGRQYDVINTLYKRTSERISNAVKHADTTKKVLIGSEVVSQTPDCFKQLFGDKAAIIIADKNTYLAAGKAVEKAFALSDKKNVCVPLIIEDADLYAEQRFVDIVTDYIGSVDAVPIAVGSGTINDLVKVAAHKCGRPYMVVATAGSMDGYTAFGASISVDGFKQTISCPAPAAVIADIDIIVNAPAGMNASGYADLIAKIPAGADWILADALGIEAINQKAWQLIQSNLREWVKNPLGVKNNDKQSVMHLIEGLIMSGLAMQAAKSSRPASGADHQFSHLWDVEHHVHNCAAPSHGFKVGIGSICSELLYENILAMNANDIETDLEAIKKWWPQWRFVREMINSHFTDAVLAEQVIEQSRAKYICANKLAERLKDLSCVWSQLKQKLQGQLLGAKTIYNMITAVGAPSMPPNIGIDFNRLRKSFRYAQLIRKRYTVLDLALEAGWWNRCVDNMFLSGGFWDTSQKNLSVNVQETKMASESLI